MLKISNRGIDLIANWEGWRAQPYRDSGGLLTIGFGQRITDAQAKKWAAGISREEGRELLAKYLDAQHKELERLPLAWLLQHQVDAISSLAYNIGFGNFHTSTIYTRIVTKDGDLRPWLWWVKDEKKQTQPGLIKRRQAELHLFLYATY